MKVHKKELFIIMTSLLCVALFIEKITGKHLHALFGIILIAISLVHIYKKRALLKGGRNENIVCDMLLFITFIVCSLSGIMLCPLGEVMALKIVHKLSSLIFLILMIKHIFYYRRKR